MSKSQVNAAIIKVAESTNTTKEDVAEKMMEKDQWTWFLIKQAA